MAAPAEVAHRFLADGLKLGGWAFGCWNTVAVAGAAPGGLFRGHSLFDGAALYVRLESDPAGLTTTYHVGGAPDRLMPRIVARIVPGPLTGRGADECLVTLLAWRDAGMSDERWRRVAVTHATEVLLVKALIERGL